MSTKYMSKRFISDGPHESGAICTSIQRFDNKRCISLGVELRIQDCTRSISLEMDFNTQEEFIQRIGKLQVLIDELSVFREALIEEGKLFLFLKEELEAKLKAEEGSDD